MWVARDKDDVLNLYTASTKPWRAKVEIDNEIVEYWDNDGECIEIDGSLFPDLKWDHEPLEVEITLKN